MNPVSKGIDVSAWNNIYDPSLIKSSGVDFAILREGYSTTVDKTFMLNYRRLHDAGLKIPGVYHFAYSLNAEQAVEEAKSCIRNLEKVGVFPSKDFTIFFDFEYDTVTSAAKRGVRLIKEDCNKHTLAFCDYVESTGFKAGVYFNVDYYKNWYDPALLDRYVKWLAYWNGQPLYNCDYHQYYNKGRVSGIRGDVDMNYYYDQADKAKKKTIEQIAAEVLDGKWGNGQDRYKALTSAGYNYYSVQAKVNEIIQNGSV